MTDPWIDVSRRWYTSVQPGSRSTFLNGAQPGSGYMSGPGFGGGGGGGYGGLRSYTEASSGGGSMTVAEIMGGDRPFGGMGKTSLNLTPTTRLRPYSQMDEAAAQAAAVRQPGLAEGMLSGLTSLLTGVLPGYIRDPLVGGAGTVGQALDIPLEMVGHVPLPWVKSREEAFAMLPMTDEKRRIQEIMLADPLTGANYVAAYIREHEGDLMSLQGMPRSMSGFFRPDATLLERAMAALGIPGDLVARTYAGFGMRDTDALLRQNPDEMTNEALASLVRKRQNNEITQDQFLDDLVAAGYGFTNDAFGNFVSSMLTDPLIGLNFGIGKAAKIARVGAVADWSRAAVRALETADTPGFEALRGRLATRLAEADENLTPQTALGRIDNDMLADQMRREGTYNTYFDQALGTLSRTGRATVAVEPAIKRMADVSKLINDPLAFFGPDRVGQGFNAYLSDRATRGHARAYGYRNYRRTLSFAEKAGPVAAERLERARATEVANRVRGYLQQNLIKTQRAAAGFPDTAGPRPTEITNAMATIEDPTMAMGMEKFTRQTKPDLAPEGVTGETALRQHRERLETVAARKYAAITGVTEENALRMVRNSDDNLLALAESDYFGHSIHEFTGARESAASEVKTGLVKKPKDKRLQAQNEWVSRATLVGPRELTMDVAEKLLAAARSGDLNAIRGAINQFDSLYGNFGRSSLEDAELLARVEVYLATLVEGGGLTTVVSRDALPNALKDFFDRNARVVGEDNAYRIGIAPAADQQWRVVTNDAGELVGVNPWVDLASMQSKVYKPTRLDMVRNAMFGAIRGDRLLDSAHRQFRKRAMAEHRLSRGEADSLFYSIRRSASARNIHPRGFSNGELVEVARNVAMDPAMRNRMGERGIALLVAQAFEGDLMEVGLSSKFSGWSKTRTAGWGNFVGQVAEKVYPLIKFSVNPIFLMQELVEPYYYLILRGIKPGFRWSAEDQQMLALLDRYNMGDAFTDQSEYVFLASQGWANTTAKGFGRTQEMSRRVLANRAQGLMDLKRLNYIKQVRSQLGENFERAIKDSMSPSVWATLQREFETVDPGKIALRYWTEKSMLHPDDPQFATFMSHATMSDRFGRRPSVRLNLAARHLGFDTPDDLRNAVRRGDLDEAQFHSLTKSVSGWNEDYRNRLWRVASFESPDAFFERITANLMAGGQSRTAAERAMKQQRGLLNTRANVRGESLEEYLASKFSDSTKFLTSTSQIPPGAFNQTLKGSLVAMPTPSGIPVRVYEPGDSLFMTVQTRQREILAVPSPERIKTALTDGVNADKARAGQPVKAKTIPALHQMVDAEGNAKRVTYSLDDGTESIVFGRSTMRQHADRMEGLLSEENLLANKEWYDQMTTYWMGHVQQLTDADVAAYHQILDEVIGKGTMIGKPLETRWELAARLGVGWGGTQQNTSVIDGVRQVHQTMDYILRLKRAGELKTTNMGAVTDRLKKVLVDVDRLPDTMKQKLYDFNDALAGRTTRTITGGADGLQPAAMDVWMNRWFGGNLDTEFRDYIHGRFNHARFEGRNDWTVEQVEARLRKDLGIEGEIEGPYTPAGAEYEYLLRETNDFAKWANDPANHDNGVGWLGRDDWTATEVQAVMWASVQRAVNYMDQGPPTLMALASATSNYDLIPSRMADNRTYFPSAHSVRMFHGEQALRNIANDVGHEIVGQVRELTSVIPTRRTETLSFRHGEPTPSLTFSWAGSDDQIELANAVSAYLLQQDEVVATAIPLKVDQVKAYPRGTTSKVTGEVGKPTAHAMDWVLPEGTDPSVALDLQRYMGDRMYWQHHVRGVDGDDLLSGAHVITDPQGRPTVRGLWEPTQRRVRGKREAWKPDQNLTASEFNERVTIDAETATALEDGSWHPSGTKVAVERKIARVFRSTNGEPHPDIDNYARQYTEVLDEVQRGGDHDQLASERLGAGHLDTIRRLGGDVERVRGAVPTVRRTLERAYGEHAGKAYDFHRGAQSLASDGSAQVGGPTYYQRVGRETRGATHWNDEQRATIYYLKNADEVTAMHELFHGFRTELDESAKRVIINSYTDAHFPRRLTPYERSVASGPVPEGAGQYLVHADRRARAGERFHNGITATYRDHPYGRAVTVKDRAEYDNPDNLLYTTDDGLAGALVTPDGDLVSVFKHPDSVAHMDGLLADASSAAKTLDGFDINGVLPNLYAKHGFRPVARVEFDINEAPPGWDVTTLGKPDVVFMVRDTEGVSGLPLVPPREAGGYASIKAQVPVLDYDKAYDLQQTIKNRVDAKQPKPLKRGVKRPNGQWTREVEEWAADQFVDYVRGAPAPSSTLHPIFNAFGEYANKTIEGVADVNPRIKGIFDQFLTRDAAGPRAQWNLDDYRMLEAFRVAMSRAEESAHTTHYYRRGRSFVERSVNHPYLGLYPASYMWGKVIPEMLRFLVQKPFGIDAPFAGLAMATHVYEAIQMQTETDPVWRDFFANFPQGIRFLQMMIPGTPWEVPVNAPAWLRHYSENERENQLRVARGLKPVENDIGQIVSDTLMYAFGPGRLPVTLGEMVGEFNGSQQQAEQELSGLAQEDDFGEAALASLIDGREAEPNGDSPWSGIGA